MKKQYSIGNIQYGFSLQSRKWEFKSGNFTFLCTCPKGKETADKVANVVNGAMKRSGEMDGLARANVKSLTMIGESVE